MSKMSSYFLHLQDTGVIAYEPKEYYEQFNSKDNANNDRKRRTSPRKEQASRAATGGNVGGGLVLPRDGNGQRQPSGADLAPEDKSIPE
tara:strand:+ start:1037 stop:1303 length:267 start_codon:yes stop_codon:yes gene_type:complete